MTEEQLELLRGLRDLNSDQVAAALHQLAHAMGQDVPFAFDHKAWAMIDTFKGGEKGSMRMTTMSFDLDSDGLIFITLFGYKGQKGSILHPYAKLEVSAHLTTALAQAGFISGWFELATMSPCEDPTLSSYDREQRRLAALVQLATQPEAVVQTAVVQPPMRWNKALMIGRYVVLGIGIVAGIAILLSQYYLLFIVPLVAALIAARGIVIKVSLVVLTIALVGLIGGYLPIYLAGALLSFILPWKWRVRGAFLVGLLIWANIALTPVYWVICLLYAILGAWLPTFFKESKE